MFGFPDWIPFHLFLSHVDYSFESSDQISGFISDETRHSNVCVCAGARAHLE